MPDTPNPRDLPSGNAFDDNALSTAWDGGYRARKAGRRRTECPYEAKNGSTELANAWLGGWLARNMEEKFDPDHT